MDLSSMDPELTKRLLEECAVFVLAGVPVGTEFGIDFSSYKVAENFRGVKLIPPGPHFVYCASVGSFGETAPRVGFIHYFHPQEVVIREWSHETEELRVRTKSNPEVEKRQIRENLLELDRFLAPYDYEGFDKWKSFSRNISEDIINRCSPSNGLIRTCTELLSCSDSDRPRGNDICKRKAITSTSVREEELLPKLEPIPGTAPNFTELPPKCPLNVSPSEISKHHLDCIEAIDLLLAAFSGNYQKLIEENEFAFLLYMVGHSVESLAHWRKILELLSSSEEAVACYKQLYMSYITCLGIQIPELPEELMSPTPTNTVFQDVRKLLLNATMNGLSTSTNELMCTLKRKMEWSFDDLLEENPEYMPMVVELETDE